MNTVKKAIEHFYFKLNPENNIWKATDNDVKALNLIMEFTESKLKKQYNNNQLFGKLYITFYGELLKYYNATVFDKEPQKALHQILDTPMEVLIQKFLDKANLQEQTITHSLKNGFKHPEQVDTSDIKPNAVAMTYEEAEANLTALVNMALNSYK
jgi:hypothetical protein